jgi:NAD(P)H-hydrate epimerase
MSHNESNFLPRSLYRASSVRELDRIAIEEQRIPGFELMRRAGRAAFSVLQDSWPHARRIAVFCGAGNNGGDGFVLAARAVQHGIAVDLYMLAAAQRLRGDARSAYELAREAGVEPKSVDAIDLEGVDVIVDGLLGTGLSGPVRGAYREVIECLNQATAPIFALDIPSGLCSDTGSVLGTAITASRTISFIGLKQGMFTGEGRAHSGDVHFHDLAVPASVLQAVPADCRRLDIEDLRHSLPARPGTAHKGHYGHVLVVGGDYGMGGAAALAARAAGRSGAGLVSLATRPEHVAGVMAQAPEVMCHAVHSGQELEPLLQRPSVIVLGPGLGQQPWGEQMVQKAWAAGKPLVVDADALNIISQGRVIAKPRRDDWVITPHPGEAARLLGVGSAEIQADRFAAVAALQSRFGGAVLLKGSGSLALDARNEVALCPYGNAGMASGGMGDVLSGVVGGLLAQGLGVGDSAAMAMVLHARAADMAAASGGERGLLASDLLPWIRRLANS